MSSNTLIRPNFSLDTRRYSTNMALSPLERATTSPNGERLSPFILTPTEITAIDGIEDIARAEVMIKVDGKGSNAGNGSGFIISDDGLVITNRHVITSHNKTQTGVLHELEQFPVCISVKQLKPQEDQGDSFHYKTIIADVVAISNESDLALLKMRTEPELSLSINETTVDPGQDSYTMSHPHESVSPIVTWGEVMTKADVQRQEEKSFPGDKSSIYDPAYIFSDNSVGKGSSGSPLLNNDAQVIGVVARKFHNPRLETATHFSPERYSKDNGELAVSVKNTDVLKFLDQVGIKPEHLSDGKVRASDQQVCYRSNPGLQDYKKPDRKRLTVLRNGIIH